METFIVKRSEDFMVMPNHHLRNKELSLDAKGLLSMLWNFQNGWDYPLNSKSLAAIYGDEIDLDSILQEIETEGYLIPCEIRNEKGVLARTEYVVLERPKRILETESSILENKKLQSNN